MSEMEEKIKAILEDYFWIKDIEPMQPNFRTQDDCEGDMASGINVTFSPDGDAWVRTEQPIVESCRFRMPMKGGGASPRTRTALMILAYAIKLDNEENNPRFCN